ncbi:MAG: hypothetical protein JJU37_11355 [Balneolaceae bacterium]|nr:hypothetical protein [Balneolaceae bacterium]
MEKLLIGAITVLILLAVVPIKSATFNVANETSATTSISNEAEESQSLLIRLDDTLELVNSDLKPTENMEADSEVSENKEETETSDRGVFLSIGSMLLIGILILLPF